MDKSKGISLIITIIYFVLSAVLFAFGELPEILAPIETLLTLPALIAFGFGYGGGSLLALIASIVVFLFMWAFFWMITNFFTTSSKGQKKSS